jgi:hypothetical protein
MTSGRGYRHFIARQVKNQVKRFRPERPTPQEVVNKIMLTKKIKVVSLIASQAKEFSW